MSCLTAHQPPVSDQWDPPLQVHVWISCSCKVVSSVSRHLPCSCSLELKWPQITHPGVTHSWGPCLRSGNGQYLEQLTISMCDLKKLVRISTPSWYRHEQKASSAPCMAWSAEKAWAKVRCTHWSLSSTEEWRRCLGCLISVALQDWGKLSTRVRQRGEEEVCARIQGTSMTMNEWKRKQLCNQYHKRVQSPEKLANMDAGTSQGLSKLARPSGHYFQTCWITWQCRLPIHVLFIGVFPKDSFTWS